MRSFYELLGNTLITSVTNNLVWFALTFWVYLETQSVISTSIISGLFLIITASSGIYFGGLVDHNKKKYIIMISNMVTLGLYIASYCFYALSPDGIFKSVSNIELWLFLILGLLGVIVGNIRGIAIPTLTTLLVVPENRDKANGMTGTIMGISFALASVGSGLLLARAGMSGVLITAIVITILSSLHLMTIKVEESEIVHGEEGKPKNLDLKGTIKIISSIPGLFALIFFTTFNNFLGGVFMALMDAYGLSLVSLETWGALWGILSLGFIVGGLFIAKYGLGDNPLKRLFLINIILWIDCIFFTIQPSIWLLASGMALYVCLVPFIEAIEHTIIQKVVPLSRQGRVFGFAQSVESAASPVSSFAIGPITQLIFIPWMTVGGGVELIGSWYGVGQGRGIALVFSLAGILGLIVTLIAMRTKSYTLLAKRYTTRV